MNSLQSNQYSNRSHFQGSSLAEFLVFTIASLPIVMGIVMIGKMIDLKQTSINASRYTAWEATVADNYDNAKYVKDRFFKKPDSKLKTEETSFDSNVLWGQNGALASGTYLEKGSVRIVDDSAIAQPLNINVSDEFSGINVGIGVSSAISKAGDFFDFGPHANWKLEGDGLLRAAVEVKVKTNQLLDKTDSTCFVANQVFSCMEESNSIMVDHWSARDDEQSADRSRTFVPSRLIKGVGNGMAVVGKINFLMKSARDLEYRPGESGFGMVNTDVLPKPLSNYKEN